MRKGHSPIGMAMAALILAAAGTIAAQFRPFRAADDKALDWRVLDKGYTGMMEDHARRIAFELNLGRDWPGTAAAIEARQKEIREKLRRALGMHLLEKTGLDARTTGKIDRGDYVVEKLVFTSLPGVSVTANVYAPKAGGRKSPAVLFPHGHWPHGRFQPEIQARAIGLAKLGYIVLTLDKYGYGERKFTGHHEAFYLLPSGLTLEGLQIWDNMRALDYLLTRADVDPEKIGITGASGGGNQTMYTASLDTRIAAAAPTVSVNTFDGLFFRGIGCACEGTPGVLRFADEWDILSAVAPRPLFIPSTLLDPIFPVAKAREAYLLTRGVYEALGAGDKIAIRHFYDEHAYNREMRESVYGWFDHVFKGQAFEPVPEGEDGVPTLDFDSLRAMPEGGFPPGAKSLPDLALEYGRKVHRPRTFADLGELEAFRRESGPFLRDRVLGGFPDREKAPLRLRVVDRTTYGSWSMLKVLFWSDWDIILPGIFVGAENPKGTVILAPSGGKETAFLENWVEAVRNRGFNALVVDLRGLGETGEEHRKLVQNGLVTGKPVVGEWVWDLSRCADAVEALGQARTGEGGKGDPVYLLADGAPGLAALLAPAFDKRMAGAAALGPLATYLSDSGFGVDWLFYLPGVLEAGDLPELYALSAPRRLVLAGPVRPSGTPAGREEIEPLFRPLRRAFDAAGAPEDLILLGDAGFRGALEALLR